LNSATAALELTLYVLGIKPGDEVITSAYTYTASCSPICHIGATPVLVDTSKNSVQMDYEALENAITEKTKVIIPVDIAGTICDYDKIFEIVQRKKHLFKAENEIQKAFNRVIVVADAAHSFGSKKDGKVCGNIADFTTFSFHAVKNLTTAEGGAVTWKDIVGINNDDIYNQYMLLSLHGQNKDALAKTKIGAWEYDIIAPNYKCNMTDIAASIGIAQLERYDGIIKRREEIIKLYNNYFKGTRIKFLDHYTENLTSCGHLYITRVDKITIEQRNQIIISLAQNGIVANVHYKPLPMMTAYKNLGFNIKNYPNAYNYFSNEISLPLHTLLSDDDVKYIAQTYLDIVNAY
ncbi:MAG: DegT/DnrJ/EryC1/StrS family aminotransferase, partial [Oscillospiraceae bacterium]